MNAFRAVLAGLALGALTMLLMLRIGTLALVLAVMGIVILRRWGLAAGGGILVSFGLGWVWAIAAAEERCAAFNRQPGGGCQSYGTTEQLVLAACVALLGVVLSAIALRAGEPRAA